MDSSNIEQNYHQSQMFDLIPDRPRSVLSLPLSVITSGEARVSEGPFEHPTGLDTDMEDIQRKEWEKEGERPGGSVSTEQSGFDIVADIPDHVQGNAQMSSERTVHIMRDRDALPIVQQYSQPALEIGEHEEQDTEMVEHSILSPPSQTVDGSDNSDQNSMAQNPTPMNQTLRIWEFNGMMLKLVERILPAMKIYLKGRQEWTMFVREGKVFRTITNDKRIQYMEKHPGKDYSIVPPDKADHWKRKGWKLLKNKDLGRLDGGNAKVARRKGFGSLPKLIPSTFLKNDQENSIRDTEEQLSPGTMNSTPSFVVKHLGREWNILGCEEEFRRLKTSFDDSRGIFLLQNSADDRSLVSFHTNLFPMAKEHIESISEIYICACAMPNGGFASLDLSKLRDAAMEVPVWLIVKTYWAQFQRDRAACVHVTRPPMNTQKSTPPESGFLSRESDLFDEDEESFETQDTERQGPPTPNVISGPVQPPQLPQEFNGYSSEISHQALRIEPDPQHYQENMASSTEDHPFAFTNKKTQPQLAWPQTTEQQLATGQSRDLDQKGIELRMRRRGRLFDDPGTQENQALEDTINPPLNEGSNSETSSHAAMRKEVEGSIRKNMSEPPEQGHLASAHSSSKEAKEAESQDKSEPLVVIGKSHVQPAVNENPEEPATQFEHQFENPLPRKRSWKEDAEDVTRVHVRVGKETRKEPDPKRHQIGDWWWGAFIAEQKRKEAKKGLWVDGSGGEATASLAAIAVDARPVTVDTANAATTTMAEIQPESEELDEEMNDNQPNSQSLAEGHVTMHEASKLEDLEVELDGIE